jgi:hypothetical protein
MDRGISYTPLQSNNCGRSQQQPSSERTRATAGATDGGIADRGLGMHAIRAGWAQVMVLVGDVS